MPFKPGQSGNPKGRRRKSLEEIEVEKLARLHDRTALNALVRIATKGQSESAVVAASVAILDRGHGKPMQPVESDVHVTQYGIADHQPSADEWAEKYDATTH